MSARPEVPLAPLAVRPMALHDLPAVAQLEQATYLCPWSEGNFRDSLEAGYSAWTLEDPGLPDRVAGYFVLMAAFDEAHLLNVTVHPERQKSGYGLLLLRKADEIAKDHRARTMILEVRPSNERAREVYHRFGFVEIGRRRGYYPRHPIDPTVREDALVLSRRVGS